MDSRLLGCAATMTQGRNLVKITPGCGVARLPEGIHILCTLTPPRLGDIEECRALLLTSPCCYRTTRTWVEVTLCAWVLSAH